MGYIKYIIVVLSSLIFMQCSLNTSSDGVITIDVKQNYVDSVDATSLLSIIKKVEILDTIPIGYINKVKLYDNKLFVSDMRKLHIFDLDGNVIDVVNKRGRSNDEYNSIRDFEVVDNYILILDGNRKFLKYNILTKKVELSKQLDNYLGTIYLLNSKEIITNSAYQKGTQYKFNVYDLENFEYKYSFNEINKAELNYRQFIDQDNYFVYDGSLIYHEPLNDIIYTIENKELTKKYRLSFYNAAPDEVYENNYKSVVDIMTHLNDEGYSYGTPFYAEGDEELLFTFKDKERYLMNKYNKENKMSMQFNKIKFEHSKNAIDIINIALDSYRDDILLFSMIDSEEIEEFKTKLIIYIASIK